MQSDLVLEPEAASNDPPATHPVLIIEDDESAAEVLAIRLDRQGYSSLWTKSGRQGIELARQRRPSLVLLDLRLPDVDGFSVCQELDESPETCGIPIIILSGMERPDIIRRARAVGCSYFVRKPYDPNALLILIERAIDEAAHPDLF